MNFRRVTVKLVAGQIGDKDFYFFASAVKKLERSKKNIPAYRVLRVFTTDNETKEWTYTFTFFNGEMKVMTIVMSRPIARAFDEQSFAAFIESFYASI